MNLRKFGLSLVAVASLSFTLVSCGPKDADIQKAVQEKLANTPGITADVKDGVVTLNGEFADDATKNAVETDVNTVKGVKSLVDNATVTPAPVQINGDDVLKTGITAALKDYPEVVSNVQVQDSVITLTGDIKKADLPKIMQALMALHPKKVVNNATVK